MRVAAAGARENPIRSTYEQAARKKGYSLIAGADEAGRGSLFGPVYAAAVILDKGNPIRGLRDSKQLSRERREVLAVRIRERALAWAVATADATEIDAINIYQASRLAIQRAVSKLQPGPDYLLVDALQIDLEIPQEGIIHGDALSPSIAAASILAKVDRDACLCEWDQRYPAYGLARHKGYPTPEHLEALALHGPTPHHRMSYAPVRQLPLFPPNEAWV
ncbi:MAG: ribonuclease HII [Bryobacterales bacterium]|nr:ribonuclease HII [Bryobacterales bacterium]